MKKSLLNKWVLAIGFLSAVIHVVLVRWISIHEYGETAPWMIVRMDIPVSYFYSAATSKGVFVQSYWIGSIWYALLFWLSGGILHRIFWKQQCPTCSGLPARKRLRRPKHLTEIIKSVKKMIAQGHITGFTQDDFMELKDEGPWEDMLSYEFKCTTCKTRYRLSCDTYHGNGEWSIMHVKE